MIVFSQMNAPAKNFDETECMTFLIEDDALTSTKSVIELNSFDS